MPPAVLQSSSGVASTGHMVGGGLEQVQRRPRSWSEGWSPSAVGTGWESWGCAAWGGEGSGETLEQLPVPGGADRKAGEGLWARAGSGGTGGNGLKLREGRFRLDVRKKPFPVRAARRWPRLPRAAVGAPSLAGLKARLDGAGSSLGWWGMSLTVAGGLSGPLQPKPFCDSLIIIPYLCTP